MDNKTEIKFNLTSTAFENEAEIPRKFCCDGENISPDLKWNLSDSEVESFALIMDDPDAPSGDFVHWVIYNIPSSVYELPENFSSVKNSESIYPQGINGSGKLYYVVRVLLRGRTGIISNYMHSIKYSI